MEEKINKGCEFQNNCIEYKDISYLKNMPICAIYELSIACHDKENKCKYYKLYKQLKRLEQENKKLKARLKPLEDSYFNGLSSIEIAVLAKKSIRITSYNRQLEHALEEIRYIANQTIIDYTEIAKNNEKLKALDIRNRMSEIQNIITEAIGE